MNWCGTRSWWELNVAEGVGRRQGQRREIETSTVFELKECNQHNRPADGLVDDGGGTGGPGGSFRLIAVYRLESRRRGFEVVGIVAKRVVIIEDNTVFRQMLAMALGRVRGLVVSASFESGKEGLAYCLKNKPDLLAVDLFLPDLHGLEIIREVRAQVPATRILVLTGHPDGDLPARLVARPAACQLRWKGRTTTRAGSAVSVCSRRRKMGETSLPAR